MTIEKPFEWLFNRFKQPNIKPCKFDIECLTFLAEWVNRQKEKNKQENILFAKLFCLYFAQEIQFYKDIPFAQKSVANALKMPLEEHYKLFKRKLNDVEFNKYLLSIGINPESKHFIEDENEKEILKNAKDFFKNVHKWDYDKIEKSLNAEITETINRYQNLQ